MEDMNVSNVSEEVVTPQIDETIENNEFVQDENVNVNETTQNDVSEEVVEPQVEEKPVQTPEQNAMFAKIRRESEQRARDQVISEMGMTWNDRPIRSYQEYQQALREQQLQQEAESQGLDPQFYVDFKNMQDKLSFYERNNAITQQDYELASDPVKGDLYNQWRFDVREMADRYNVDLRTAFSVVLEQRLGDVLAMNQKKIQQDTIKKINTNSKTTPGALGAANDQPGINYADMSEADFEKIMAKAMRGELKRY